MDKGNRVVVVSGPHEGNTGTIFWVGQSKRGPGERYGVKDDRGETLWLDATMVEASDKAAPSNELPEGAELPDRGKRVEWTDAAGEIRRGEVFWFGEGKGGGKRCGVREDVTGETHWRDAIHVTITTEAAPPEPKGPDVSYNKGDAVEVLVGQFRGQKGEVFWTGENKFGSGQRLGVRIGEESAWVDASQVKPTDGAAPGVSSFQPSRQQSGPGFGSGESAGFHGGFEEEDDDPAPAFEVRQVNEAPPDMPPTPDWDHAPFDDEEEG